MNFRRCHLHSSQQFVSCPGLPRSLRLLFCAFAFCAVTMAGCYDNIGYPRHFSLLDKSFDFAGSGRTRQVCSWLHSEPYLFRICGPRSENQIGNSERKLRPESLIGKSDRNPNRKFGFSDRVASSQNRSLAQRNLGRIFLSGL